MSYATSIAVANYLGLSEDDALLAGIVPRAQAWIDSYTRRTFEAAADAVHYFEVGRDTVGRVLYLDADLCQITEVKTNLDNGSGGETLAVTDYVVEPRNRPPFYALELRMSSNQAWRYTRDPVDAVSIEGRWSYSLTAPADIEQACVRLAAYLYKQKDAQIFDVTAMPESGTITVPKGMPLDVKQILDRYVRASL